MRSFLKQPEPESNLKQKAKTNKKKEQRESGREREPTDLGRGGKGENLGGGAGKRQLVISLVQVRIWNHQRVLGQGGTGYHPLSVGGEAEWWLS